MRSLKQFWHKLNIEQEWNENNPMKCIPCTNAVYNWPQVWVICKVIGPSYNSSGQAYYTNEWSKIRLLLKRRRYTPSAKISSNCFSVVWQLMAVQHCVDFNATLKGRIWNRAWVAVGHFSTKSQFVRPNGKLIGFYPPKNRQSSFVHRLG